MNWKSILYKHGKALRAGLCVVLCAAILSGLFLPATNMVQAKPRNPLEEEGVREITALKVGDNIGDTETIVVPEGGIPTPMGSDDTDMESEFESDEQEEGESEETETDKSKPEETIPEETEPSDPSEGNNDEGNDDGQQGEEGGDVLDLDMAAVMTWYKYGTDSNTIVCAPSSTAYKTINTAQLLASTLKYEFDIGGADASYVEITEVKMAAGDSNFSKIAEDGKVEIELPGGTGDRNYTFRVTAFVEKPSEKIEEEITFTFALRCEYNLDLEMTLTWQPNGEEERGIVCGAEKTEVINVKNYNLNEDVFGYSIELGGSLAEDATIIDAKYSTNSGQDSGSLSKDSGTLILKPAQNEKSEIYYFTFVVETPDQEVIFTYKVIYQRSLDVQLEFEWMEKGTIKRLETCKPENSIHIGVKNNQLSAGSVPYEMRLVGTESEDAEIVARYYESDVDNKTTLKSNNGSIPMKMAAGESSNTYHVTVTAMARGERLTYEIVIQYYADVSLKMEYTVYENGVASQRTVVCENSRTVTAERIYDDQLTDGELSYTMLLTGSEGDGVAIAEPVTCFQSGSGKVIELGVSDKVTLMLEEGKIGENTFEIEAIDGDDNKYHFTIEIPYIHRGQKTVKIWTNLTDGQEVINGTRTNLSVRAWTEDENGNRTDMYANGTNNNITVWFDDEEVQFQSGGSGVAEYHLYPKNPAEGDKNEHKLFIRAEDAYGNYGEETLTLIGLHRETGQSIGKATIVVDMTVLGMGKVAEIEYDVLADEPIGSVTAKAILGEDMGEPYGTAKNSLGWEGIYDYDPLKGFFLDSLTVRDVPPDVLETHDWPDREKGPEAVWKAIDERFGEESDLAILWRCLFNNGFNKNEGAAPKYGVMNYTNGSGWTYCIDEEYPKQGGSEVYLQPGQTLTWRYTLAWGHDLGGGAEAVRLDSDGFCITAKNGVFSVNHLFTGDEVKQCRCCGIIKKADECYHEAEAREYIDNGDGTHSEICSNCGKVFAGSTDDHELEYLSENKHGCKWCDFEEKHYWDDIEGTSTADCTQSGTKEVECVCGERKEVFAERTECETGGGWDSDAHGHYEICAYCKNKYNEGEHDYDYAPYRQDGELCDEYECSICDTLHGEVCWGTLEVDEGASTCERIEQYCTECGYTFVKYEENHNFVDGSCEDCGESDPDYEQESEPDPDPEQNPDPGSQEDPEA